MAVHKISKGLDVPIAGEPTQQVDGVKTVSRLQWLRRTSLP